MDAYSFLPSAWAVVPLLSGSCLQGQLVDPMQQQQGLDMQQMQPGMDAAAMQQMVYHDPSGMQVTPCPATLSPAGLPVEDSVTLVADSTELGSKAVADTERDRLSPVTMRQGGDPALQAALGDHQGHPHAGMEHPHAGMEHQHTGLEHHHSGLEHHSMEHQHPDMDHHHLEHAGHAGEHDPAFLSCNGP